MKNIIAITSLLAAGTLCASAETINFLWEIDAPTYRGDTGNQWLGAALLAGEVFSASNFTTPKTSFDFTYSTSNKTLTVSTPTSGVLGTYLDEISDTAAGDSTNPGDPVSASFSFDSALLSGVDKVTLVFVAPYQYHDESKGKAMNFAVLDVPEILGSTWSVEFASINLRGDSVSYANQKISPIPEPSAFGLLAGLGALALAGTRRRRAKKA